jgi:hypothetical protein
MVVKMDGLSSDRFTSDADVRDQLTGPVVTSPESTDEWKSVKGRTKEARSRKDQG